MPHQSLSGHPCPGSGYDVPTASMPPGTLGMNREPRVELALEHGLEVRTWHPLIECPGSSTRLLIIRRSSSPSRRRTRGPPETAGMETALALRASSFKLRTSHFQLLPPFPSGRPARYGIVRPTDYLARIGTVLDDSGVDCFDRVALRFAVRSCLPIPYRHPWRPLLSWRRHP